MECGYREHGAVHLSGHTWISDRCTHRKEGFPQTSECDHSDIVFQHINPREDPSDESKPTGRSGHCMCSDGSNLYVFGGYSPQDTRNGTGVSQVFPELWKLNFASHNWEKIFADNTPYTCASASMAIVNGHIFVFGGTGYPFGQSMSNTIKTLKLENNSPHHQNQRLPAAGEKFNKGHSSARPSWNLLETSALSYTAGADDEDATPRPAYGQSFILHNNSIYVFAGAVGYYSEAVSDLHKLSLDTMTWEKLHPSGDIPNGRYKQEIAKDAERFYVLGGGRLHHAESMVKVYAYNYSKNQWTEICTIPDACYGSPRNRCSFGCAQVGRSVYVSGGRYYSSAIEHESLSDIWHLCLDTMKWTKLHFDLPVSLYFHSTVVSPGGYLYIFGGVRRDGYRSPTLYRMRLPLFTPKLSEMCWDRVLDLVRQNTKVSWSCLSALGIPWNFLERC